jgi:hypothetical protein
VQDAQQRGGFVNLRLDAQRQEPGAVRDRPQARPHPAASASSRAISPGANTW